MIVKKGSWAKYIKEIKEIKTFQRLKVVIWPPPPPPTSSLLSGNNVCIRRKNIMDPERINEYKRQKEIEMEAIRRKERETMRLLQKQVNSCILGFFLSTRAYYLVR